MMGQTAIRCLRSEIEEQLKLHGYTLAKLGHLTGIRSGHLSQILNGKPPRSITIGHLDAMAAAFGHAPGWLYPEECCSEHKLSRPRLVPYLVRCAEVRQCDCIDFAASRLLDIPKNIGIFFSVAERLFEAGKQKESVIFYRLVIDNERDSFHDRFIMSQYRLFRALIGMVTEDIQEAVIRFEAYYNRLPEDIQLDALVQMINVYYALEDWGKVERYADELHKLTTTIYQAQNRRRNVLKYDEPLRMERDFVEYYEQGFIMKGIALIKQEKFEMAKKHVKEYSAFSWFSFLEDAKKKETEKFLVWNRRNMFMLNLMIGNATILPEFTELIEKHPNDILPMLIHILDSANKFDFAVDDILERFSHSPPPESSIHMQIDTKQMFHFWYQKSKYSFRKGEEPKAVEELLYALSLAQTMKYYSGFERCVSLFWLHVDSATHQQKRKYQELLEGGYEKKENGPLCVASKK
ncbi:helix-turn-helix transcriptional regulator [Paenibacillus apiarius]|uniref:helix-turn-helix transcriptional regulator n=1 Tax=Paenibacillus apiarius TaxID=46240 RepID=UPI00197CBB53|nr:helix-turn-helix transcriptional regulator [Paenibacillus apiarius]